MRRTRTATNKMTDRLEPAGEPDGDEPKPFLDHLEDLRWTLGVCLLSLLIGMLLCALFVPFIIDLLTRPLSLTGGEGGPALRSLRPTTAITVILRVSAWSGLLVSLPAILYFIARFVFPGLTDREKKVLLRAAGFSAILFAFGVGLGYIVCLPVALKMMLWFHGIIDVLPEWTINDYTAFVIQLLIGFGLSFQMPVVLVVLGKLGLVTRDQLRTKRRHAAVACLVIGMIMTPADVASQLIMAVPLYLLYEICIWVLRIDERDPE